jgi:hypothetical protein
MRLSAVLLLVLAAAGSALARDRPRPEDRARSCPRHGPGFVEIPGTTSCVRIGGRVQAEAGSSPRRLNRDDIVGLRASGRVSADARSDTAYGPLRAFVRVRVGDQVR